MMLQFVGDSKIWTEEGYREVEKEALEARGFYSKPITEKISDESFTKMMMIDGCFILQFIDHCRKSEWEKLEMTNQEIVHVKRDLLLLENQLPLSFLKLLLKLKYKTEDERKEIINHFPSFYIQQTNEQIPKWVWRILTAVQLVMTLIIVLLLVPLVVPLCCIICCFFRGAFKDIDQLPPPPRADLGRSASSLNSPSEEKKEATGDDGQPTHLLGLLYSKFMNFQEGNRTMKLTQGSRGHYLFHSAKNLKKIGIHFRPSKTGALTDVKFESYYLYGTLKLPPITIDASTKSVLLNLVAYEKCAARQHWVTSYICFMDSLIDDAGDVEELRSEGILFNHLGSDQQVAELFNDMNHSLEPDADAYNDIKRDINERCGRIVMRWVSEWRRTYFRSPWTVITVLAASLGLALTATQTYYAIV